MSTSEIVLEYLKVLLSTPPVLAVVAIVFIALFRTQIAGLINSVLLLAAPDRPTIRVAGDQGGVTAGGCTPENSLATC